MNQRLRTTILIALLAVVHVVLADTYSYTFSGQVFTKSGTLTLSDVRWTLDTDAGYFGSDNNKGQQIGSGSKPATYITLSTSDFSGTITSVAVNASTASSASATLSVSVGGTQLGEAQNLTTSPSDYTFTSEGSMGEVVIRIDQTTKKAIYIRSIDITYSAEAMNVVGTAAELAALDDGSAVKMVLADGINARVLYATSDEAYVRDATGAFCMSKVKPNVPFSPNQHLAGVIWGKKTSAEGMTVFEATSATNTAFLVIAEPVTEPEPEPLVVDAEEAAVHQGDWVWVNEARIGTDAAVQNRFGLTAADGFTALYAYEGALADLSAIVRPDGLCPVDINGVQPFRFVMNEQKDFVAPPTDLADVAVRLVRTFPAGTWTTLCLPFSTTGMEGQVRTFSSVGGSTLSFTPATAIEAGKPCLFKPDATIQNPVFTDVTLVATSPEAVTIGEYSMVGTYSPRSLVSDGSERVLSDDGSQFSPSGHVEGMRAFFRMPAETDAAIDPDGLNAIREAQTASEGTPQWFNLSGQRVRTPQKGVYISNGHKYSVR